METLFTAGPPDLVFQSRPGTLSAEEVRKGVAALFRKNPGRAPVTPERRQLLEGVVFLWHDLWAEAHHIAQSREGEADFDLLHAIGHRREGDYPNAKYWFASAGNHPSYPLMAARLAESGITDVTQAPSAPDGSWAPLAFVDQVRRHARKPSRERESLVSIQAVELKALAEWLGGIR